MKHKFFNASLIGVLCFLILNGCRPAANNSSTNSGASVTDAEGKTSKIADSSRIVSVGTATTETIYALGAGERLVGVDNSSREYFPESKNIPTVGARTVLNAEGILSLKPTLLIMNADSGPPQVAEQLKNAGIGVLTLTPDYTIDAIKSKILMIAKALGLEAKGVEVRRSIDGEMSEVAELLEKKRTTPKVLFVGRGPNMPNATMSGAGTTIDEMIKLADGANTMNDFTGFREMTDEAVGAAQPDIILMTEKSFERSGGTDGVLKFPGVVLTPAGENRRVVTVSDVYFQGFGPGVGKAVRELAVKFHPELAP